jgi:hypothetical protein
MGLPTLAVERQPDAAAPAHSLRSPDLHVDAAFPSTSQLARARSTQPSHICWASRRPVLMLTTRWPRGHTTMAESTAEPPTTTADGVDKIARSS